MENYGAHQFSRRKYRSFRAGLIHCRLFSAAIQQRPEENTNDIFRGDPITVRYRFASSLPAINPLDAITNFRGQNSPSLSLSLCRAISTASGTAGVNRHKRISDAKFTQFTVSRN
jgi:hypothetical protein